MRKDGRESLAPHRREARGGAAAPAGVPENGVAAWLHDGRTESCERIWRSIAYMLARLDQPLQVATLAAVANLSPSHYFALFKRCAGCAPIDCFIRLRMWRAWQLLDSQEATVKEVAEELGYEDAFYFSRVFKSVYRVAPSHYQSLPEEYKVMVRNSDPLAAVFRRVVAGQPAAGARERSMVEGRNRTARFQNLELCPANLARA